MHPGFGQLPRADWIANVRDLAGFYSRMLREMALGPVDVIGFSLGGWIAAEMAAADAGQFRRMALVAPTGVRPPEGEILDLFILTARAYLDASVHDAAATPEFASLYGEETAEQFEAWEDARAESARLAWKPYMHNPSLPHLLEGVQGLPTLIVWGPRGPDCPRFGWATPIAGPSQAPSCWSWTTADTGRKSSTPPDSSTAFEISWRNSKSQEASPCTS